MVGVLALLALDLGVFHRHSHEVKFQEAFRWTLVWVALALGFAVVLNSWRGRVEAVEFVTGYVLEFALSMDNVFVIALIFGYFRVPANYQHRVLFWGILGALIMRGFMIGAGTALVARFHWLLYFFGAFLVYTGIKMCVSDSEEVHPETNPVLRFVRRLYPISKEMDGQKFSTWINGRRVLTPLALVLVMVETSDLIFALDSIPAIFAVTTKPFVVFTSNVFAILGLRSLYFVLAGAIQYFRYMKYGLSVVLIFIGAKMLVIRWFDIPTGYALIAVATIISSSILLSVLKTWSEKRARGAEPGQP